MNKEINLVLAIWNPLKVPSHIALHEYSEYVPKIIHAIEQSNLLEYLFQLTNEIRIVTNDNENEIKEDLCMLNEMIMIIYNYGTEI